ncbi:MAG TPA: hypothetical protein VGG41_19160, partial [Solirubrobacteraceae bacterium]
MSAPNGPDVFAELPILEEVGAELERILGVETAQAASGFGVRRRRRRWGRLRPLVLVFALVVGGTAVALAATGVILTGSPVRPSGPVVATAGDGVPVVGDSRLLPLRIADPAGGLPWGMRVVHTTRALVCVQVGRIEQGRLGQLGIDGAFGDDGRFHSLPADVLPDAAGPAGSYFETCNTAGRTFGDVSVGLEASGANNPPAGSGLASARRVLSFGLLGRHAVSVTYGSSARTRTQRVVPGLGAYLIVQRDTGPQARPHPGGSPCDDCIGASGESNGDDVPYPQTDPAGPIGAVTAIAYEFAGRTCIDNAGGGQNTPAEINESNARILSFRRSCGLSEGPPPRPAPLPPVHEQLAVHLQIHGHVISGAEITFAAPIAITKASQSYLAWVIVGRHRDGLTGTGANFARGATVSLPVERLLAQAGTRSVKIEIDYALRVPGPPGDEFAVVGTTTVHEPTGTHPKPLPAALKPRGRVFRLRRVELLGLRASDPAGGPPWGIQLGFSGSPLGTAVSIEIGRVANGRIGFLGQDDAYHNDGRFHPATSPAELMSPAGYAIGGPISNPALQKTNTFD